MWNEITNLNQYFQSNKLSYYQIEKQIILNNLNEYNIDGLSQIPNNEYEIGEDNIQGMSVNRADGIADIEIKDPNEKIEDICYNFNYMTSEVIEYSPIKAIYNQDDKTWYFPQITLNYPIYLCCIQYMGSILNIKLKENTNNINNQLDIKYKLLLFPNNLRMNCSININNVFNQIELDNKLYIILYSYGRLFTLIYDCKENYDHIYNEMSLIRKLEYYLNNNKCELDKLSKKVKSLELKTILNNKINKRPSDIWPNNIEILFDIIDTIEWKEVFLNIANEGYGGIKISFEPLIGTDQNHFNSLEKNTNLFIVKNIKNRIVDKITKILGFNPEKYRYYSDEFLYLEPLINDSEKNHFENDIKIINQWKQKADKAYQEFTKKPYLYNIIWNRKKPNTIDIHFFDFNEIFKLDKDYNIKFIEKNKTLHGKKKYCLNKDWYYIKNIRIYDCIKKYVFEHYNITNDFILELKEHA